MMRWTSETYEVELASESTYSFGSADNVRSYDREYLLCGEHRPLSVYGVHSFKGGEPRASAVLGASGGGTRVHEHSAVAFGDRCVVAVGNRLVCLRLPDLEMEWSIAGDDATCFGVHLSPNGDELLVHGELAISKLKPTGEKLWQFSGRDIFTGEMRVIDRVVAVSDFEGAEYRISLEDGQSLPAVF